MKKIFFAFLLFIGSQLRAQIDINIPVEELNVADTAFNHHPVSVLVRMQGLNATYDTAFVYVETTYENESVDSSIYLSKATFTKSVVKIPLAAFKAGVLPDGTLVPEVIDAILEPFKLRMKQ
jgi:hypothetical protein